MVKVPWPANSSYDQLTPSHVTVKRCSGGCHGGSASCVATATSKRKVRTLLTKILNSLETLLQVAVLLARCPLGGGACDKECATVEVEDEVENILGFEKSLISDGNVRKVKNLNHL